MGGTLSSSRLCTLTAGVLAAMAASCLTVQSASATPHAHIAAYQSTAAVVNSRTFSLPRRASHVALHWLGARSARIRVAFSRGGRRYGRFQTVQIDEVGEQARNGETYGAVLVAPGARAVRVVTNRPIRRVSVLALTDSGHPLGLGGAVRAASADQPTVLPRAAWGADESLRYNADRTEKWPPAFYPVQKLIVHHTDTQNNDPDPAATIRSIYYYHTITQGWGDIGYNFLIDEAGRIYEGRHSRDYPAGASPTGADAGGNGVTAAHAKGFNSGTVGVALLGTLTSQDATPAARAALERLLAWEAGAHGIDPQGSGQYTNPVSGLQKTFPNIAGHRDVNDTECPGGVFYARLPELRSDVAAMLAPPPSSSGAPAPPVAQNPAAGAPSGGSSSSGALAVTSHHQGRSPHRPRSRRRIARCPGRAHGRRTKRLTACRPSRHRHPRRR
ncbi:MAG: hypothetical protein NVSMB25_11600 [Thermoleophilaceae bacterium]